MSASELDARGVAFLVLAAVAALVILDALAAWLERHR